MRKYLYIFKSEIMSNLQYIFNAITALITYTIFIFIFQNLWQFVYSDPNQLINGFDVNQMIWYVTITEIIIMSVHGSKIVREISHDFKTGNIAYNLNKPYSYIKYLLASKLGANAINFVMFTILGFTLGLIFIGAISNLGIIEFIIVLITMILACVTNLMIVILIGILSFYMEDSSPIYWIYSKFLLVLGVVFPVEFFPEVIRPLITYSPIYAITSGPANLLINFTSQNAILVITIQIIYISVTALICTMIYKKGVKRLSVNGG